MSHNNESIESLLKRLQKIKDECDRTDNLELVESKPNIKSGLHSDTQRLLSWEDNLITNSDDLTSTNDDESSKV
jgi:hypothetical protein